MPPFRRRFALVSALALLAAAGSSQAQEASWLSPGQTVDGALETGDARGAVSDWNDDLHLYDDYLIRTVAGQRFEISLSSEDFDSHLTVYRAGGDGEALASDDDGAGYPNAFLRFTPPAPGDYRIRVRGFGAEARGAYRLVLTERPAAAPEPAPIPIREWGAVQGELAAGDPEMALEHEPFYDAYSFRARQGDRLSIRLQSDDFDPYLYVGHGAGADFEALASNDDSGGDFNSFLRFTAPEDGTFIIRASSFSGGAEGAYVLTIGEALPPAPVTPLDVGQTIRGVIDEAAAQDEADSGLYVPYGFRAEAGQRVAFSLSSGDFDAYLELGRDGVGGYEAIAFNDDADGLNSRLVHVFEEAGVYELRATSFSGSGVGAYTLSAELMRPDPEPTPLSFGQAIQGEIDRDSAETSAGERFDAYRFSGAEGQRVQVVMRSGDFDTYLHIGRAGGEFEALASDDDGLGEGLNSRLIFTLPETGDYIVRATSFGGVGLGLYALEMMDRGPAPAPGSLLIGATVRGVLDQNDNMIPASANYYDEYRFRAEEGDRLRITMVSNEFDAFLMLGRGLDDEFEILSSDDDSLSDTNSMIEHEIAESGWYVLRASSYAPNSTGAYAVSVERRD